MKAAALTALAFCAALAACMRPAADAADATANAKPEPAAADAPMAPSAAPAIEPAAYEFYLLPRDGKAVKDPRIVSTQEHPCGPIDLVRVSSIPMNDPVFVPYFVVEFDGNGKEIAKWGVPSDVRVTALEGDRLKFETDTASFWVTPDGVLEKSEAAPNGKSITTTETMFDCPALPTFADSGAEQCFRVKDGGGAERRIAKESVCS